MDSPPLKVYGPLNFFVKVAINKPSRSGRSNLNKLDTTWLSVLWVNMAVTGCKFKYVQSLLMKL